MVAALLAQTGVPPEALCLEVTETAVLAEPIRAATRLAELRALGVRIAFDDFGTGYSSLRHLSQLPVDVIKLDRTFVSALSRRGRAPRPRDPDRGHRPPRASSAISVIAEGVEDAEQLAELQRAGCELRPGLPLQRRDAAARGGYDARSSAARQPTAIRRADRASARAALTRAACRRRRRATSATAAAARLGRPCTSWWPKTSRRSPTSSSAA